MNILIKNIILDRKKSDIFIEGKKIKKIGENLNLKADQKIDGKRDRAVLPSLINCHTHAAMSLFRGYGDDLPLKEWLEEKIWPLEAKLTEDDVYWGTKLACLEMIKTGTTCFNDMYWHPQSAIKAIKDMGLRAIVGLTLIDFDPKGNKENIEKLYKLVEVRPRPDLVRLSIAPHSIYTVSKENLIWARNFAKRNNLILHTHISETEKEVKDCIKEYGLRPVEYLEELDLLNENCILAHLVWLSDKEIKILAKRKSSVVYNPCSNMKLASGIVPYRKIKTAGINICLGTDSAASNNNLDLFEEMKFASLLQKVKEMDSTVAPASEILEVATKNGAKALKINAGEIKEGKLADLILIDLNKICFQPGHNFISDIVYSVSDAPVSDVICDGQILMRNRKVEGEEEIKKKAAKRAHDLIKRK